MRLIYSFLVYLLAPLIPFYLKWRGRKNPDYLTNWHERFGFKLKKSASKPIIWLHSVSVGETRAMAKLIEIIEKNLSNYQILITTMTPTGRKTAQNLYPQAIVHYIPYDFPYAVKKFYTNFKPKIGIIMETEIWPNLIYYAAKNEVALYLVNARLSERSYRGYNRFKWCLLPILNKFKGIFSQDEATYNNFLKLGYTGTSAIVGNTKFDLILNDDFDTKLEKFKTLFGSRKVVTLASSRDGEEEIILNNLELKKEIIYLIIPRHPERFATLEELLIQRKITYQKRSANQLINSNTQVVIGDSMGEMLAYYAISYIVLVGGSFKDFGGQNLIEAIYMQVPVIFGPSTFNFKLIAQNALKEGCAIQIQELNNLNAILDKYINTSDDYNLLKRNCQNFINQYQGASQKIYNLMFHMKH